MSWKITHITPNRREMHKVGEASAKVYGQTKRDVFIAQGRLRGEACRNLKQKVNAINNMIIVIKMTLNSILVTDISCC